MWQFYNLLIEFLLQRIRGKSPWSQNNNIGFIFIIRSMKESILALGFADMLKLWRKKVWRYPNQLLTQIQQRYIIELQLELKTKSFIGELLSETIHMHLLINAYHTYNRRFRYCRRVYERRGSTRCSDASEGPPCTG